ncbi:MAG: hypothetical protein ABIO32_06245 [Ferruginibacter sp.]
MPGICVSHDDYSQPGFSKQRNPRWEVIKEFTKERRSIQALFFVYFVLHFSL